MFCFSSNSVQLRPTTHYPPYERLQSNAGTDREFSHSHQGRLRTPDFHLTLTCQWLTQRFSLHATVGPERRPSEATAED